MALRQTDPSHPGLHRSPIIPELLIYLLGLNQWVLLNVCDSIKHWRKRLRGGRWEKGWGGEKRGPVGRSTRLGHVLGSGRPELDRTLMDSDVSRCCGCGVKCVKPLFCQEETPSTSAGLVVVWKERAGPGV